MERSKVIVFTGPECAAKSTVSKEISEELDALLIPEYARAYIEALSRPYTYEDVEAIAIRQRDHFEQALNSKHSLVICDTFLIITKVWFQEVFGRMPDWLHAYIQSCKIDLHLLCYPDLDWVQDGVRENEDKRLYLFECYRNELENYNFAYEIVRGQGIERINQAQDHINQIIK